MFKRISRLLFVITVLLFVTSITRPRVVRASLDDECSCGWEIGHSPMAVEVYLRDFTWQGERFTSYVQSVDIGDGQFGAYFCHNVCWNYGLGVGQNLCNSLGIAGQGMIQLIYYEDYYDFNDDDGGSSHTYYNQNFTYC
jgi:hypothetical protein